MAVSTKMAALPRLYLGTMTLGWNQASSVVDGPVAAAMLEAAIGYADKAGLKDVHVDTARIYAGGQTERILGGALKTIGEGSARLLVGTKAHPSQDGGLSAAGISAQLAASQGAVGATSFHEYYLHQPDTEHSLLESLRATDALVKAGTVKVIGLSNYHAAEVQRAFDLCREHNLAKPTVYQGLYNPLNRLVEAELLPVLRANGCAFVAYNPLAAGLLTGKHAASGGEVLPGRFKENPNYLPRFYTEKNFAALDRIRAACAEAGLTMIEATFRWLLCHSQLTQADGVLIGASSMAQLEENLQACAAAAEKPPLPANVLEALDSAAVSAENGAFPYWRSYSADMPGREDRDQGASYSAKKAA